MSIPNSLDTAMSGFASIARLPFGSTVSSNLVESVSPKYRIKALYDIEQSKNCRQVRERITELDLVVDTIVPAAANSRALNDESYKYYKGGYKNKEMPIMVVASEDDGDDGETTLVGVENIMEFLNQTYGSRGSIVDDVDELKTKVAEFLIEIGSYVPQIVRLGRGESVASCADSTLQLEKPLVSFHLTIHASMMTTLGKISGSNISLFVVFHLFLGVVLV